MAINYISMPCELIVFVMGIVISILILRRNHEYKGNIFYAAAFISFAMYALMMFIYDLGINEITIKIAVLLSLPFILLGTLFLVISMQIFVKGEKVIHNKSIKIFAILTGFFVIIPFFTVNQIEILSLDPVSIRKDLFSNLALVAWNYTLMIYNLIVLKKSLEEMSDVKEGIGKKVHSFYTTQILALFCPIWSVIGNIVSNFNLIAGLIITSFTYVVLAIVQIKTWLIIKK